MKSKIAILAFLAVVFLPIVSLAAVTACETAGAEAIDLDPYAMFDENSGIIAESLADYRTAGVLIGDAYYLNFDGGGETINVWNDFNLALPADENRDVYICNLKVSRYRASNDPVLTVHNLGTGNVYVDGLTLRNVKHGLRVIKAGTGNIFVTNTVIVGNASRSGACLAVAANGATVRASELSSCSEGIRIEANNTLLGASAFAHYDDDKNVIHDNGIGIYEVAGMTGNQWAFNSLYGNTVGIQSQRAAPRVVVDPETGGVLHCAADENRGGIITQREIHFEGVPGPGEMILYVADVMTRRQGRELLGTCSIDTQGICRLETTRLTPPLDIRECGRQGFYITAIFNDTESSDYLDRAVKLLPFGLTAAIITAPYEIPTTGVAPSGNEGVNTGGGSSSDDDEIDDDSTNQAGPDNTMSETNSGNPTDLTPLPESDVAQTVPDGVPVSAGCSLAVGSGAAPGMGLCLLFLSAIAVIGLFKEESKRKNPDGDTLNLL